MGVLCLSWWTWRSQHLRPSVGNSELEELPTSGQSDCLMALPIRFVPGFQPQDARARELVQAEIRSHAAKVGHKKLRQKHQISNSTPSRTRMGGLEICSKNLVRRDGGTQQMCSESSPLWRPPALFQSPESARLLQFWLTKAAPFMTRGRYDHHGVLDVLVPQHVCQSVIVNQAMMAHALTHWTLIQTPSERRAEGGRQALWHYTAAITEMRRNGATPLEKLLVSYLGWTIEGLQGNMARSQIHLKGLKALVYCLGKEDEDVRQGFEPLLLNAEAVQSMVTKRAQSDQSFGRRGQVISSDQRRHMVRLSGAGQTIRWIFCYILVSRLAATKPEAKIHDGVGTWLESQVMQHPLWQKGTTQASTEDILQMFADAVATLLPHHAVADLDPADADHPEVMIGKVENCLDSIIQTSCGDDAELIRTLRLIVDLCMKIWTTEPWKSHMQGLARAVDFLEDGAFGQKGFLAPERVILSRYGG